MVDRRGGDLQQSKKEMDDWVKGRIEMDSEVENFICYVDDGHFEPLEVLQALGKYGSDDSLAYQEEYDLELNKSFNEDGAIEEEELERVFDSME